MGRIYLQGTPVIVQGATIASHLNIVLQTTPGSIYIIGAGPLIGGGESLTNLDFEQGPILFNSNWRGETLRKQAEFFDEEAGVNLIFNDDGSVKNGTEVDLGARDPLEVWEILKKHVSNINGRFDYEAGLQNSNSAANTLLSIVGISTGNYFPPESFGAGYVASGRWLDLSFSLDGTSGDDIINGSPIFSPFVATGQNLFGKEGNDDLRGGAGNDRLDGVSVPRQRLIDRLRLRSM